MAGQRSDLKQKAYEYIKEKIVKCEWMPEEDISEDMLVNEMGVSRTPIREALQRLENEKLVNIYPRKGVFVSSISVGIINSVFQVREIVEPQVLGKVIDRLPEEWLLNMRKRFLQSLSGAEGAWHNINIDREFHSYIIKSSNNVYLIQLMESIFAQDERIRILSWKFVKKADVTNGEHLEIIDALLERDISKAEACMRNHIVNARNSAISLEHHIK